MKRKAVFISSTIYDLFDERNTIYDLLEYSGFVPLASERPNFNIGDGKDHSYQICFNNIEEADILISVLAHRHGGLTEYEGKVMSISLAEVMHALKNNKIVYIFCDQNVSSERIEFNRLLKAGGGNKEEIFSANRSNFKSDTYKVFDNVAAITKLTRNNWISFYSDKTDLVIRIKAQLANYNLDLLESLSVNYSGVVSMLKRGTDLNINLYDSSYDDNRIESRKLLTILHPFLDYKFTTFTNLSNANFISDIAAIYADNTKYANSTGMNSAERCADENKLFYGFDTQMDLNSFDIWHKDRSFKNYLLFTKSCAKKRHGVHYRIFVFERRDSITENSFMVYQNAVLQIANGIIPIITTYFYIPIDIPYPLLNCNAIHGEKVLVVILPVGFTMLYTKRKGKGKLALYDEAFIGIKEAAEKSQGAVLVRPNTSFEEFSKALEAIEL